MNEWMNDSEHSLRFLLIGEDFMKNGVQYTLIIFLKSSLTHFLK